MKFAVWAWLVLLFSDIASDTMAVSKELRWLAAAGECGWAATSYRLVTSDKSVRLTAIR